MGSVDTSMALLMNPRYTVDWACNHTNPSHGRTVPFRGLQPRSDEVDLRGSILRNTNTRLRTSLTSHSSSSTFVFYRLLSMSRHCICPSPAKRQYRTMQHSNDN